jgi:hypothetical protein
MATCGPQNRSNNSNSESSSSGSTSAGGTGGSSAGGTGGSSAGGTGGTSAGGTGGSTAEPSAKEWESSIGGKHLSVYFKGVNDGSSSQNGSVVVTGGEQFDIYLCSNKSYSATYVDTRCTSVSVDGASASSCGEGDHGQEQQFSGTWRVEIAQGTPYLIGYVSESGEEVGFSVGSDGTNFYLDQVATQVATNPYCN